MRATCKTNNEDIRIYINGILHLRIPRDEKMILESWIDNPQRLYKIQIQAGGYETLIEYDKIENWKAILKLLNQNI